MSWKIPRISLGVVNLLLNASNYCIFWQIVITYWLCVNNDYIDEYVKLLILKLLMPTRIINTIECCKQIAIYDALRGKPGLAVDLPLSDKTFLSSIWHAVYLGVWHWHLQQKVQQIWMYFSRKRGQTVYTYGTNPICIQHMCVTFNKDEETMGGIKLIYMYWLIASQFI